MNSGAGLFTPTEPAAAARGREDAAEPTVWGVDPATVRVSIAYGDIEVGTHSFTRYPSMSAARHRAIYHETVEFAEWLACEHGGPRVVFVEQASGKFVTPPLIYAVGQILAAVSTVCEDVRTIPSSSWKLAAVGHGSSSKDQILKWAQRRGYRGALEDEADALGVRCAGAKILEPQPQQLALG